MKTLTLVCSFLLLGLLGLGIITEGIPHESTSLILILLILAVTVLNIVMIAGSNIRPDWYRFSGKSSAVEKPDGYRRMKIVAIALNFILLGSVYWYTQYEFPVTGKGFNLIIAAIITGPILSILRISAGRYNRFRGLKRTALLTVISLTVLFFGSFITLRILIGQGIRENISLAQKEYPGKAEDALLAFLADSLNSPYDRTHIAIWTLGQIRSRKALPDLQRLYKNDPAGYTCKGRHNTDLCQYEIHKAIVSIENNWLGAKEKNWFGSWTRLNR